MLKKNEIVARQVVERKELWSSVRRAEPIQQIRRIMRGKQILNKDLAECLGVSEASISRLLRGQQNLQIDTLYQLADALEESVTIIVGQSFAQAALDVVSILMGIDPPLDSAEGRLLHGLVTAIEEYEKETYPFDGEKDGP